MKMGGPTWETNMGRPKSMEKSTIYGGTCNPGWKHGYFVIRRKLTLLPYGVGLISIPNVIPLHEPHCSTTAYLEKSKTTF